MQSLTRDDRYTATRVVFVQDNTVLALLEWCYRDMNNTPKYVISTTLDQAEWQNSTLIKSNVVAAIRQLKQQPGKDIAVSGSCQLVHTLVQNDLVDEYSLLVYPLVLGNGKRLFPNGVDVKLKLVESKTFPNGVILLRYVPDKK